MYVHTNNNFMHRNNSYYVIIKGLLNVGVAASDAYTLIEILLKSSNEIQISNLDARIGK